MGILRQFGWTTAAVLLLASNRAFAGNSRSFFLGDEAAMTGGAGIAVSADSGCLWYNPAGLGGLKLGRMELTGTVYSAKLRKLDNVLETTVDGKAHTASVRADDFGSVPTSLVFVRHLNDKISYGAAWYQTADAWLDFRTNLQVPVQDSSFNWSEGIEYHQRAYVYHIGPSIGIQLAPTFRIGASLYFVYRNFNASIRSFAGIGDDSVEGGDLLLVQSEYYAYMDLGLMIALGIQWEMVPKWHLGVVLRTPTFRVWVSTDESNLDAAASNLTGVNEEALVGFDYVTDEGSRMTFKQTVPMEAQLGLTYRSGRSWIGLEAAVRPPLVDMDQKLLWNASLGGRLALTDVLSWGAGIFTDNSAVHKDISLINWRSDRYGFTTGLEFKTPLIVKSNPKPEKSEADEKGSSGGPDKKETKKQNERVLTWATTLALSYSFEIADYGNILIDGDQEEFVTSQIQTAIFHQGFVYLGTALYF